MAEIDRYLLRAMPAAERSSFEAACMAQPELQQAVAHQQHALRMVRWFARDAQRQRLAEIAAELEADPGFRNLIRGIFQ